VDDSFGGLLLQGDSPAIDRGVAQYVAVGGEAIPPDPLTGFIGAAPDLGWREFGAPIVITPTASPIPSPTVATLTASPTLTFTPITPAVTVITATPLPTMTAAPPSPTVPAPTVPVVPTATAPPPTIAFTPTPQPTILNITPNTAPANTTVNLTITGSGFINGAVINFEGGQGTAPQVTATQVVNPTTIVITVNSRVDAAFGTQRWDIRVTDPNNSSAVLTDAFTITVTP
jgi:hypothetical protein